MPTLSCDPAYSQLLDTNQELRDELQDEISINKSNEKKIRSLIKELEQCYRTISLQDNRSPLTSNRGDSRSKVNFIYKIL